MKYGSIGIKIIKLRTFSHQNMPLRQWKGKPHIKIYVTNDLNLEGIPTQKKKLDNSMKRMGKIFEKACHKEDMQMVNKHIERRLILLFIKEV